MSYAMLVNQRGSYPTCQSQVSVWDEDVGEESRVRTEWFPTSETQILVDQLALALRIKREAGPETKLHVLHDGIVGFIPDEEVSVAAFIEEIKQLF